MLSAVSSRDGRGGSARGQAGGGGGLAPSPIKQGFQNTCFTGSSGSVNPAQSEAPLTQRSWTQGPASLSPSAPGLCCRPVSNQGWGSWAPMGEGLAGRGLGAVGTRVGSRPLSDHPTPLAGPLAASCKKNPELTKEETQGARGDVPCPRPASGTRSCWGLHGGRCPASLSPL